MCAVVEGGGGLWGIGSSLGGVLAHGRHGRKRGRGKAYSLRGTRESGGGVQIRLGRCGSRELHELL